MTSNNRPAGLCDGQAPTNLGYSGSVEIPELGLWPVFDDIDPRWDEERTYDEASGPRDPHNHGGILWGYKC